MQKTFHSGPRYSDVVLMFQTFQSESCPRQSVVSPAYSNDSSVMTSSTATEKSVRFSDRDYILSTPGPI